MRKSSLGRRSMMAGPARQSAATPNHRNDVMCTPYSESSLKTSTISKGGDRPARPFTMSSDSRRSTLQGKIRKDDRPLSDKNWQSEKSSEILSYLNQDQEGREAINGVKNLRNMSTALFLSIFNIFMRKLDSKTPEMNKANYITQIPIILKLLDYIGKVDKSFLQTVNTPHNYGFVLGILDYLLSLVQARDIFMGRLEDCLFSGENDFHLKDDDPINSKLMYECARAWFEDRHIGNLITYQHQYDMEILEKSGLSDMIFQELKEQKENLVIREKQRKEELVALHSLKQKLSDLEGQVEGKRETIKEATAMTEDLRQRTWQAERDYEDCIRETKSLEIELGQLMTTVDKCNSAKIEFVKKEKQRESKLELIKQINSEKGNLNILADIIHGIDTKAIALQDKVDQFVTEHNKVALKLAAEVAGEGDFQVSSVLITSSNDLTGEHISKAFKASKYVMELAENKMNKLDQSILNFQSTEEEKLDQINSLKEELQRSMKEAEELKKQEESVLQELRQCTSASKEVKDNTKEQENVAAALSNSISLKSEEINAHDKKLAEMDKEICDLKHLNERIKKIYDERIKADTQKLKEKFNIEKLLAKIEESELMNHDNSHASGD